jgi:diaminohydroxyphosphoribosylaminopyrimidine deaminase/5-amino-6-(5-phosphoribosylamino)uracil reductase
LKSKVKLDFSNTKIVLAQISAYAYAEGVQSLWVEGGAFLLGECLAHDYWDEINVLRAPQKIGQGLPAPAVPISAQLYEKSPLGEETLSTYVRENTL